MGLELFGLIWQLMIPRQSVKLRNVAHFIATTNNNETCNKILTFVSTYISILVSVPIDKDALVNGAIKNG